MNQPDPIDTDATDVDQPDGTDPETGELTSHELAADGNAAIDPDAPDADNAGR